MDHGVLTNEAGTQTQHELVVRIAGRVDAVLADAYPEISRARLQRLVASGHVLVNGETVLKSARVGEGDTVTLVVPESAHEVPQTGLEFEILYENEVMLAINKPAGVAVHGAPGDMAPCVAFWFLERFPGAATAFDVERPGIVHRLDKDTSGVLLLAKTPAVQAFLSAAFEARTVKKTYLAVTDGIPDKPRAIIDAPLGRHPGDRMRMAVVRQGREARTSYEVIASAHGRALVELHPETGRTHQIRVHLAAIGAPVLHDRVYGKDHGPAHAVERAASRQLLHAWQITIPHPLGGSLQVTSPLPADMADAIRDLGDPALMAAYAPSPPERLA